MRRYRIEYYARYTVHKIIVPHTQLAIKWFNQMTKTLKPCSCLSATIRPRGSSLEKSKASGPRAGGIVKVGKLKLTFDCFVLSVCVCVRSISGRVKQYRRLFVCLFLFKVWVYRFFR